MATNYARYGNIQNEPELYNRTGAVTGFPGPDSGVEAAAGNPGPKIIMNGGTTSRGPSYYGYTDVPGLKEGDFINTYAPVTRCNNNQCGGKKTRRGKGKSNKSKRKHSKSMKHHKKSKRHQKKSKRHQKKSKRHNKKTRRSRSVLSDVRGLFRMRGGEPASFTSMPTASDRQYMTNVAFSNSYSAGGDLHPSENALANPVLIQPTNNCN